MPFSGSGLLWQLRPSDVEVELLAHTRQVVSHDLEEETGMHTGWIQNGGLFIASNRQRLDEYKRLMSVGMRGGYAPRESWARSLQGAQVGDRIPWGKLGGGVCLLGAHMDAVFFVGGAAKGRRPQQQVHATIP